MAYYGCAKPVYENEVLHRVFGALLMARSGKHVGPRFSETAF